MSNPIAAIAREAFGTRVHMMRGNTEGYYLTLAEYAALIRSLAHVMGAEYNTPDWLRTYRSIDAVITTYAGWHGHSADPFVWYGVERYVTNALSAVAERIRMVPVSLTRTSVWTGAA